jgi:hypothetical protein
VLTFPLRNGWFPSACVRLDDTDGCETESPDHTELKGKRKKKSHREMKHAVSLHVEWTSEMRNGDLPWQL